MKATDVIRIAIGHSDLIIERYLNGLEDADLQLRPIEGMNCIAWQLGHLLATERQLVEAVKPGSCPPLPEGFEEAHVKEGDQTGDTSKYLSKNEYVSLMSKQRAVTKAVLDGLSDADLDAPAPEHIRNFLPNVGAMMLLTGTHVILHSGQFVAVRRKLNKPVAF
jgi:hypothetical protein